MIGDIQFHNVTAQLRDRGRLGTNLHALVDRCGAGRRVAFLAFHLDHAEAARAERLKTIGCAQFRNVYAEVTRRSQN